MKIQIEANHEHNMPWMFSVNAYDPPYPFDPPKKYLERYMKILDQIPLPNYTEGELENKSFIQSLDHKDAYNSYDSNNPNFYIERSK